jgi:hypothetical protein
MRKFLSAQGIPFREEYDAQHQLRIKTFFVFVTAVKANGSESMFSNMTSAMPFDTIPQIAMNGVRSPRPMLIQIRFICISPSCSQSMTVAFKCEIVTPNGWALTEGR